jgi:undecaprenyl-diphosphatase
MIIDLAVAFIADLLVIPVVLIGAWVMLRLPRNVLYQRLARAFVTGLTAVLFAKIASLLYQGERPFVTLGTEPKAAYLNNPGFPSDHTLLVFTITFVVWASTKNRKLTGILLLLSSLVALGRVLALVHTPADVAGGIICALLAALLWYGPAIFSRHLRKT